MTNRTITQCTNDIRQVVKDEVLHMGYDELMDASEVLYEMLYFVDAKIKEMGDDH